MAIAAAELKQSVNRLRQASRVNLHAPFIASETNVHGRPSLAVISQGKLRKESISRTPDLRRCLGHNGVFRRCMKAAQEAASEPILTSCGESSKGASSTITTKHESTTRHIRSQITTALGAMTHRRYARTSTKPENEMSSVRVHASLQKRNVVSSLQCRVRLLFGRRPLPDRKSLWSDAAD
ncbi:uncharacterized protein BDW43DRAFT_300647 [Aspergillus alliaceus]|uniref:uncharacterized protein n=1 Tax=Petromyces alliaceus TaxID=209559 RepID=UPI0012A4689A|nr:uncharacterized protein BDW43DRAFT_300647 [Aspergillus alliaceus]KAB8232880.1 hypothetical protein BDW43DRAFT_300647 [Aspergillus alliaceus]